ncbi:MAG: hypothetical protein ACPGYL_14780, partial [Rhodospirillaceae bacterium]
MSKPATPPPPLRSDPAKGHAPSAGALALLASYPKSGNTWTRLFLSAAYGVLEGRDSFAIN